MRLGSARAQQEYGGDHIQNYSRRSERLDLFCRSIVRQHGVLVQVSQRFLVLVQSDSELSSLELSACQRRSMMSTLAAPARTFTPPTSFRYP
jgi:hypothetical protein